MTRVLILLTFIFFGVCTTCHAQVSVESIRTDSSHIRINKLDSGFFEQYTSDSDFDYVSDISSVKTNFWTRLMKIIRRYLTLSDAVYENLSFIFKLLFWLVIASILIFTLMKLKFHRLFYTKKEEQGLDFKMHIHKKVVDFDREIRIEFEHQNYRNALRLQFLRIVHELNEKEIISFSIEKTNYEYLAEIKNHEREIFQPFSRLIRIYNSVWYGHYEIRKDNYTKYSLEFDRFKNILNA